MSTSLRTLVPPLCLIEAAAGALSGLREKPAGIICFTTGDHAAKMGLRLALRRASAESP